MICVDIALQLIDLRNKLGMSRTSFAKSIGITETHMKRFETGVAVPKEKHINTICEKYHVKPEYFTGEIGIDEAITEMPEDDRKIAGKRLTEKNIISEKTVISYMAGWNMKETGIILEKPMMVL